MLRGGQVVLEISTRFFDRDLVWCCLQICVLIYRPFPNTYLWPCNAGYWAFTDAKMEQSSKELGDHLVSMVTFTFEKWGPRDIKWPAQGLTARKWVTNARSSLCSLWSFTTKDSRLQLIYTSCFLQALLICFCANTPLSLSSILLSSICESHTMDLFDPFLKLLGPKLF